MFSSSPCFSSQQWSKHETAKAEEEEEEEDAFAKIFFFSCRDKMKNELLQPLFHTLNLQKGSASTVVEVIFHRQKAMSMFWPLNPSLGVNKNNF